MEKAILQAQNLGFQIHGKTLLEKVSLNLNRGELTVLIGANGAGKSTLLRLLAGFLTPSSGQIFLQNFSEKRPLASLTLKQLAQQRAVMQQHSHISFPYSTEEIIRMGGYQRKMNEHDFADVVRACECDALVNKTYRQLSGGEQQRVQLARALYQIWSENMQNKLLFLDEPTSAFDLHHQQHCLRLLRQLCEARGLTVCTILHDLNLASLYADKLILLAEQTIQVQGRATAVISAEMVAKWYQAKVHTLPHFEKNLPQIMLYR